MVIDNRRKKLLALSGRTPFPLARKNVPLLRSLGLSDSIHYKHDAPTVLAVQATMPYALASVRRCLNTYAAQRSARPFVIPSETRDLSQGDGIPSNRCVLQASWVRSFAPLRMTTGQRSMYWKCNRGTSFHSAHL